MANKENIRKWVDALRSGDYEQTRGTLCKEDKYCCLGVACEVALENGVNLSTKLSPDNIKIYDGNTAELPWKVCLWLGLRQINPVVKYKGNIRCLTALNDSTKYNQSFSDIADLIEAHYLQEN